MNSENETYKYKGWLIADSFWKRVSAITGYSILGSVLIWVGIFLLIFLLGVFGGLSEDDNLDEELQELKEIKEEIKCIEFCVDELGSEDYVYLIESKLCSCFDINDNLIEQLVIN